MTDRTSHGLTRTRLLESSRLQDLLARYRELRDQGQNTSLEDLCRECPELLDEFRHSLQGFAADSKPQNSDETQAPPSSIPNPKDATNPNLGPTIHAAAPPANISETVGFATLTGNRATGSTKPKFTLPGYEMLGELGHGGMGVVYLAEHLKLKRQVALKMIRAGSEADPEQLSRFRAEAEAIAHLHHPNIVQVYEVGEHDDCPFIALELLEGGSLKKKLSKQPLAPKEAAQILEVLARAIHHAHQRGIIHRDLKPANVLLMEDGTPKITDFGLAKRLEDSQIHQTRTGAVMGTPTYMAPEQAEGKTAEIGPLADVYALGVMLYEMLTGKAPFQGDSVMDTLHKVLHEEPVPPSKLQPRLDRDLETICLKSMAKDKASRYSSALTLAQDLERYLGGEPILGRRLGPLAKTWQKIRRNPVPVAAIVTIAIVLAGSGWVYFSARATRQVATLNRQFDEALEASTWTPAHRDHLEAIITEIQELDPTQGPDHKRRLQERFVRLFRENVSKPRLEPTDIATLDESLAWFKVRERDLSETLGKELAGRLRAWQPLFDIKPPFAEAQTDSVFGHGKVTLVDGGLASKTRAGTPTATTISSPGTVGFEATFAANWTQATHLGVILNMRGNIPTGSLSTQYGYAFLVLPRITDETIDEPTSDILKPRITAAAPTFENTRRQATLQILRNGALLRQSQVSLPQGPMRLLARREGDRLSFHLTGVEPLEFFDAMPLTNSPPGVMGIHLPKDTQVTHLRGETQSLPPSASPLERADDLMNRGDWVAALELYLEQARRSTTANFQAESQCKAGLCLTQLKRPDDAIPLFESTLKASRDRWPLIAAINLCLLHLERKNLDDVDAILTNTQTRFNAKLLPLYISDAARWQAFSAHRLRASHYAFMDKDLVRRQEIMVRIAELFQDPNNAFHFKRDLAKAYALDGQEAASLRVSQEILPKALERTGNDPNLNSLEDFPYMLRWYAWLMCRQKKAAEALAVLNNYENTVPKRLQAAFHDKDQTQVRMAYIPIYLERARVHIALNQWDAAEKDLDEYIRQLPNPTLNYNFFAPAFLMKGFCQEHRGDIAGAQATWKQGNFPAYQNQMPPEARQTRPLPHGRHGMLEYLMLASLTNDLPDAEAETLFQAMINSVGGDGLFSQASSLITISPAVFRNMYRSPRGKDFARQMAFLDMSATDYYHTPLILIMYEKARQDIFQGKLTPLQDELTWNSIHDLAELFFQRRMNKTQIFQAGLAWKGTTNFLGWGGIAPTLEPSIRGPAALMFGYRYQRLNRPADAAMFFRTALADLPANSPYRPLAQTELDKLK